MKIAYIILAHRFPEQLIRLVNRLNNENALFFLHIDKKTSPEIYTQLTSNLNFPNVWFTKRISCYWGDFGIVAAMLEGIKELCNRQLDFDRLVFLSGQDYPVKSTAQIEEFFSQNPDQIFLEYQDNSIPTDAIGWPNRNYDNINYWHFRFGSLRFVFPGSLNLNSFNRYCRGNKKWFKILSALWSSLMFLAPVKPKRQFPQGFEPYRGSQFCCLPRECVEYIHSYLQQNPGFVEFFKYVDIPDEMFFQTLIVNSPFKEKIVKDNKFYIDWNNPNPTRPRIFVAKDYTRLAYSTKLFARKFEMSKDSKIFDLLDRQPNPAESVVFSPPNSEEFNREPITVS
ncbi:beta-1,6-N-acetylglucosaminyltransferase [Ancylothrix sp. C2]|uniref:beta-1,6-N-acetylglucosaminyltransferase n=1 Tax=Ancylothrix sp. D3o TaxID=2953691 RepID=UPI0021BB6207|nr:beta-1,6-N-acetylglucosaminyltransferase [Ancylothrix sp. D3o]MCT7949699.1 beta-1,6-N-acetylglucosaminyltransferase [Ancylothrix sp. D3o]